VGVLRCNTWFFAIALSSGCLQAGDTVLRPDGSGQSDQGIGSGGSSAAQAGKGMAAAGNKAPGGAAGSGTAGKPDDNDPDGSGTVQPMPDAGAESEAGSQSMGNAGSGTPDGSMAGAGAGAAGTGNSDAGSGEPSGGAADPECDFHGIWIAKQMTVSEALGLPQTSNNWYYLELTQTGNDAVVAKHYDCGIEVRGSATVILSRATLEASIAHNLQAGRKITVGRQDASCSLDAARFWSIRGADELRFLPGEPNPGRDFPDDISDVATAKPLPTAQMLDGAVDIDNDGKPGIAFQVTGIVMGTRNSVQRDWTRWFTEPGYEIAASADWPDDLTVRADFDNEESIIDPTSGLLVSNSMPSGSAKHVIKLRFLGRDASDARATAVIKGTEVETCYAIQDALPPETLE
jgi:hypothetical protein